MIERDIQVVNKKGLHARAAAKLVNLASSFDSDVRILADGQEVEGKSILGILMLGAAQGTHLTLRCDGQDEDAACDAITNLFEGRFEEGD